MQLKTYHQRLQSSVQVTRFLFEIKCQNTLGENVIWRADEQALYWTDIQGKCLYKCAMTAEVTNILTNDDTSEQAIINRDEYINQVLQVFDTPFRLGSFAFTHKTDTILAGFENGLATYQYATGELGWLSQVEGERELTRFNDGRCDPKGRFWLGSMVEDEEQKNLKPEQKGALYRFDKSPDNTFMPTRVIGDLQVSNGLAFSDDGLLMYHTDSASHKIYQYELSEQGDIVNQKLFAKFAKHSFPDGACVDKHGNLFTALWGGACVVAFNPKGKEILRHPLPVTQGSCVAIGGPSMNWLFVTSARQGLSHDARKTQARAGNVFVYELSESIGREESVAQV